MKQWEYGEVESFEQIRLTDNLNLHTLMDRIRELSVSTPNHQECIIRNGLGEGLRNLVPSLKITLNYFEAGLPKDQLHYLYQSSNFLPAMNWKDGVSRRDFTACVFIPSEVPGPLVFFNLNIPDEQGDIFFHSIERIENGVKDAIKECMNKVNQFGCKLENANLVMILAEIEFDFQTNNPGLNKYIEAKAGFNALEAELNGNKDFLNLSQIRNRAENELKTAESDLGHSSIDYKISRTNRRIDIRNDEIEKINSDLEKVTKEIEAQGATKDLVHRKKSLEQEKSEIYSKIEALESKLEKYKPLQIEERKKLQNIFDDKKLFLSEIEAEFEEKFGEQINKMKQYQKLLKSGSKIKAIYEDEKKRAIEVLTLDSQAMVEALVSAISPYFLDITLVTDTPQEQSDLTDAN